MVVPLECLVPKRPDMNVVNSVIKQLKLNNHIFFLDKWLEIETPPMTDYSDKCYCKYIQDSNTIQRQTPRSLCRSLPTPPSLTQQPSECMTPRNLPATSYSTMISPVHRETRRLFLSADPMDPKGGPKADPSIISSPSATASLDKARCMCK